MDTSTIFRPYIVKILLIIGILTVAGTGWYAYIRYTKPPASTQRPAVTKDTTAPKITLQKPEVFQNLSGTLKLSVDVSDNQGVQKVEYYVDGEFAGVTYAQPFDFNLNTTKFSDGSHTVTAKAYDAAGNTAKSNSLTLGINNGVASGANPTPSPSPQASSGKSTAALATKKPTQSPVSTPASTPAPTPTPNPGSGSEDPDTPVPDTTPPSAPAGVVLAAGDAYEVSVSWSASSDNVATTGYTVYRDGSVLGTTTATSYKDLTVVPGNSYDYKVTARDAAGNVSVASSQPGITLAPTNIFINVDTPDNSDLAAGAIELGVKFRALVNGKVTGVRFYKPSGATGTHTGSLWDTSGNQLATATYTNETASGWQSVSFSSPVDIMAGTTYVASFFAPNGGFGYSPSYFASAGITSQYLTALKNGVDGSNGVFHDGSAGYPSSGFISTNYWVDVNFAPNPLASGPTAKVADNSRVYAGYPGSNNTGVPVGKRLPKRDRVVTIKQNGAVMDSVEVDGDVNIAANNVTIQNVRVTSSTGLIWGIRQNTGYSGATIKDTEVFGDGTHQIGYGIKDDGTDMTLKRVNIHTISDGIQANESVTLTDSFIHDLLYFDGDHSDSFLSTGGHDYTITHNTLHNFLNQTAAIGLFCDFGPITNVVASNNLLIGGGYTVYAGDRPSSPNCSGSQNIKFINNRISKEVWPNGGFNGPVVDFNAAKPGSEWTGNVWHEDGTPVLP